MLTPLKTARFEVSFHSPQASPLTYFQYSG